MELGLKGKPALVLAASQGLGYACALGLAREGCNLVITSRSQERIEAAANRIRTETGVRVQVVAADVSTETGLQERVNICLEQYGGLEIAIHNAGGPPHGPFSEVTIEQWYQAGVRA